ncbi:hypothetical protein F2Q69_00008226 [Brassica cretica]|uniref:Uncharacterized protein n=1 Tax=Brassica cretica TaxID=69181 RepID=A0A8S9NYD4_BRACR|nr:hypothetical protein F2Q69_00008226 [Brassica cretica]
MAGLLISATHFHSGDVGWYRGCSFEWFTVQIRRGRSFGLVLCGDSGGFKEKFSSVDEDDGKLHVFPDEIPTKRFVFLRWGRRRWEMTTCVGLVVEFFFGWALDLFCRLLYRLCFMGFVH